MSDLTDKLVSAVQGGQLKIDQVWPRLNDQERNDYVKGLEGWSSNQMDNLSGGSKLAALGAGAGLMTGAGAALGGAAMLPEMGAIGSAAKAAWPAVKYAGTAYGIGKLPIPDSAKTALEIMLGMKAMGGKGAGILAGEEAAAGKALDPRKMGHLTDDEVRQAFKNAPQVGSRTMPDKGVRLRSPSDSIRGGEVPKAPGLELGNTPGKPATFTGSKPDNLIHELGGTGKNPMADFDEADKRKIMFGGAGEGPTSNPASRGPIEKAMVQRRSLSKADSNTRAMNMLFKELKRLSPKK